MVAPHVLHRALGLVRNVVDRVVRLTEIVLKRRVRCDGVRPGRRRQLGTTCGSILLSKSIS
jgi:hypothetical protein